MRAVAFAAIGILHIALGGCGDDSTLTAIDDFEYQLGERPAESAWKPVASGGRVVQPDDEPIWLRVRPPALSVADPALRIPNGRFPIDEVWVGARQIELVGSPLVIPLDGRGSPVTLRTSGRHQLWFGGTAFAGSQRALWAKTLAQELLTGMAGGATVLAGLLLLAASFRGATARAYRGLGLFLASLGVITLLNLGQLGAALPIFPVKFAHNVATSLYPLGFVEFVLATLGDGRYRVLTRGRLVYYGYLVVAWALHLTGLLDMSWGRAPVSLFIVVFTVQSIVLAWRRARAGDKAGRAFLYGIGTLLVVSAPDILDGASLITTDVQTVPLGVLGFGVAMVVVLVSRYTQAREAIDVGARELAAKVEALESKNREVHGLNAELRHQIAERSRQMADALQQTGGALSLSKPLLNGDIVDARYRVVRTLGQGGMGAVHEVERLGDGRHFAMKIMSAAVSAMAASRFAREAEIAARLADPHLVSVVDVGGSSSARLYLVMELIDGQPLEDLRARFGDVAWALELLPQIARGLAALHAAGVVHRDLKPGNVLLARGSDGTDIAKISDFGISHFDAARELDGSDAAVVPPIAHDAVTLDVALASKPAERPLASPDAVTLSAEPTTPQDIALGSTQQAPASARAVGGRSLRSASAPLTATGVIMGTPAYMAPELARGTRGARPPSDVYAFGLIAFELLTGKDAFNDPPLLVALAGRRLSAPVPLPATLDPRLAAILSRCLDESTDARPTAQELVGAPWTAGRT